MYTSGPDLDRPAFPSAVRGDDVISGWFYEAQYPRLRVGDKEPWIGTNSVMAGPCGDEA